MAIDPPTSQPPRNRESASSEVMTSGSGQRVDHFGGLPEREIVQRASSGDRLAVGLLYDAYVQRLFRYCLARVGGEADAEDLASEIFVKVLGAIDGFEWRELGQDADGNDRSSFAAWLFRIAHNHVVSFHRRAARRGPTSEVPEWLPDDSRGPQEQTEIALGIDEVFGAVEELPEAQRAVLQLRFGAGLTIRETAEALGKRETNVKVLQHKGVKRLRELLAGDKHEAQSEAPAAGSRQASVSALQTTN